MMLVKKNGICSELIMHGEEVGCATDERFVTERLLYFAINLHGHERVLTSGLPFPSIVT